MSVLPTYSDSSVLTYKLTYFFSRNWWHHIFYCSYFLSVGFRSSRVTQKPKYSILVCMKKELSILHLSPLSFSSFKFSSNLCTLSVHYPSVNIKMSSMYACINSNPWGKSFIFCSEMSDKLLTPIGRYF